MCAHVCAVSLTLACLSVSSAALKQKEDGVPGVLRSGTCGDHQLCESIDVGKAPSGRISWIQLIGLEESVVKTHRQAR